ncbi:armadillo-type protein [Piptocephalis cylindrospora]|uniref:Armadillo-type protein n=1 Tax=Piptocephalis cylindrospora TaxID=1907219 RepID=A0A4P9Y594_9FUNG|nr:armadillo-type protein [Piptocephalis cylindrospora]|eukprot:RKP13872.1 armadillo-type protein [Piptocephalis cylindrospora]
MSDADRLYQLLSATFHADTATRSHAEEQLKQLHSSPGFLPLLLQILSADSADGAVRQAAAVYFKNRVKKDWDPSSEETNLISETDRDTIHSNVLPALVQAPASLRSLLTPALASILTRDFPDHWPSYLPQLGSLIHSQDPQSVHGALMALRETIRVYQWRVSSKRAPLVALVNETFPTILSLGQSLVPSLLTGPSAEMLTLIFKTYFGSVQYDMSEAQQDPERITLWTTLMLQVIRQEDPASHQLPALLTATASPEALGAEEEREASSLWKAKKWAMHCLNRLFTRYGNPALLGTHSKRYEGFAKWFSTHIAPSVLETYVGLIESRVWLSARCNCLLSLFLGDAIKYGDTWALLKPHTMTLVSNLIHPRLSHSARDAALWAEDPIDYVHKRIDPLEDFRTPLSAALNLLTDLARDRNKATFLPILGYINERLLAYSSSAQSLDHVYGKDGALCMIGAMAGLTLRKKSPVRAQMEEFLLTHVIPEFTSPHGFMRARACEVMSHFAGLNFSQPDRQSHILQATLQCLHDSEIPVRIQASLALRPLIGMEEVQEVMVPQLPGIMQELLSLANRVDADTLSGVMEEFVEAYAEELSPLAVQLCQELRDTFLRLLADVPLAGGPEVSLSEGDINAMGEKTMAAMGVLKTIGTLVLSLENGSPETMQQMEDALLPVISFTLERRLVDLYDEVFEIVDCCTLAAKNVSPGLWRIFDLTHQVILEDHGTGLEYVDEMLPSLDNFINYGAQAIKEDLGRQQQFVSIINTILQGEYAGETDRVCACKLMERMMLNMPGAIDQLIPHFLDIISPILLAPPSEDSKKGGARTKALRVHGLEILLNALFYNASLTLRYLQSKDPQIITSLFSLWFQSLSDFTRVHDKKISILSLCSLLESAGPELSSLPPSIASSLPDLLSALALLLQSLPKALEGRERLSDLYGDGSGEGESDDLIEDGSFDDSYEIDENADEDGDVAGEDDEYLEFLAQHAAKMNGETADGDWEDADEGDEEDEEDDGLGEELLFETPLDAIDPYVRVRGVLESLEAHKPQIYSALTAQVTPEQREILTDAVSRGATA